MKIKPLQWKEHHTPCPDGHCTDGWSAPNPFGRPHWIVKIADTSDPVNRYIWHSEGHGTFISDDDAKFYIEEEHRENVRKLLEE